MGITGSTEQETSQPTQETKWRDDGYELWNATACDALTEGIFDVCDQIREVNIGKLRILLLGATGAGKSSLINNINAAITGVSTMKANVSQSDRQVTTTYKEYTITRRTKQGTSKGSLPCVICDFKGFGSVQEGVNWSDVVKAVAGKLRDKQKLGVKETDTAEMSDAASGFAQMLFIVLDANEVTNINADLRKTLTDVKDHAIANDIRCAVFLTKCDGVDSKVKEKISHMHVSSDVRKVVEGASSILGVPVNRVFPVKNYTEEMKATPPMQFQTLYALKVVLEDIHELVMELSAEPRSN